MINLRKSLWDSSGSESISGREPSISRPQSTVMVIFKIDRIMFLVYSETYDARLSIPASETRT